MAIAERKIPLIVELQNIKIDAEDAGTFDRAQEIIEELLTYHKPNAEQTEAYGEIATAAKDFMTTIIVQCPPGPARSRALNMVADARMVANASITHGGNL